MFLSRMCIKSFDPHFLTAAAWYFLVSSDSLFAHRANNESQKEDEVPLRPIPGDVTIADSPRARIAHTADLMAAKRTGTWPVLRYREHLYSATPASAS